MYDMEVKSDTCEARVSKDEIKYTKGQLKKVKKAIEDMKVFESDIHLDVFYDGRSNHVRYAIIGELYSKKDNLKTRIAKMKQQLKLQKIRDKKIKEFNKTQKEK